MFLELRIKFIFTFYLLLVCGHLCQAQPIVEVQNTSYARPGHDVLFRLKITRNGISGPARITYNLRSGMTVKSVDLASGYLVVKDNQMIISWLSVPTWDTMYVQCLLSMPQDISGKVELKGEFQYFNEATLQQTHIPPLSWTISQFWKFKVSSVRKKELHMESAPEQDSPINPQE